MNEPDPKPPWSWKLKRWVSRNRTPLLLTTAVFAVAFAAIAFTDIGEEESAKKFDPGDVELTQLTCVNGGKVTGTVFNGTGSAVDVYIDIAFEASGGDLVDDSIDVVRGLRPGQTGDWDAFFFESRATRCRTTISNVFRQ